jgi:hypothetical protein
MSTLSDEDLTRLLDEAASSYDVPEHGPEEILAALADVPPAVPIVRRRWVQLSTAAAVITAGAVFFAAQSGGTDAADTKMTTAQRSVGDLDRYEAPAAGAAGAPGGGAAWTSGSFSTEKSASAGMANTAASIPQTAAARTGLTPAAPAGAVAAPLTGEVGAPAPDEGESRVVKSGSIALVVKDNRVTPTITAVTNAAKSYGGYVASGQTDEYGDTPSGEVTLRVPVSHFEDLVNKVRGLDAKVRTASTTGKDVTAAYADLESQLRTLRATRERFLLILSKTKTISEILTVQQRVDNVSGQIDKIEGQRKLLANQSELSTLTVSVSEEGDPVVKATTKPRSGLSEAWHNAVDGFVSGVEAIISHSGRALLWLLCLAALALFLRGGWRVARRRMV